MAVYLLGGIVGRGGGGVGRAEGAERVLQMGSQPPARFTGREEGTGSWREDSELGAVHTEARCCVTCVRQGL